MNKGFGWLLFLSLCTSVGCASPEEFTCAVSVQDDAGEEIGKGSYTLCSVPSGEINPNSNDLQDLGEDCNEDAMKDYGDSAGCVLSCTNTATKCDDAGTSTGGLDEPKP